jgi:hypothetical protein
MKDVTILYQGGSGGFALYYYLLLSGQYQFDIETTHKMIAEQFPEELSANPSTWKSKEFWPNNIELKQTKGPKLFLICNPLFNADMYQVNQSTCINTHRILLYTNIHLQLRLAYEKQAYWFTEVSRQKFNAPAKTSQYLRQILKGGQNHFDPDLAQIKKLFKPDQRVRLEDFVNSKTLDNFPEPTQVQIDFLTQWTKLQPVKALNLIKTH